MAKKEKLENKYRVNEDLKYERELYLVSNDGLVKTNYWNAFNQAKSVEMDLVEVTKKDNLPLCKLLLFEKFLYNEKKKLKDHLKNKQEIKEIQLSAQIQENDLTYRANNCKRWIEDGCIVKLVLKLKGRELGNVEYNSKPMYQFITMCADFSTPTSLPKQEGKQILCTLKSKK
jgi:translation initiation factor IF-3